MNSANDKKFTHVINTLHILSKELDGRSVGVGIWGSGGTPKVNLAYRMAIHEFGCNISQAFGGGPPTKIPARPVFKQTWAKYEKEFEEFIGNDVLPMILAGKIDVDGALHRIGIWYEGKLKKMFIEGSYTPLSPFYKIRPSGAPVTSSSKPLIDSGEMRAAITHKLDV